VHPKHSPIHDRPQTQVIKHLTAISPHIATPVLSLTFVVESINLRDLARFMISADEGDSIWIPHFEKKQKEERLDRVESTINKVAWVSAVCSPPAWKVD
jgi:hypothetical protein